MSGPQVLPSSWDDADVQRLAAAQQAELRGRYDGAGEPGAPPSAADVSVVLVARSEDDAEVTRMYVVPTARGRGVSKALLARLEEAARNRGWTTLRLETGPRQPEAVGLYERAGYQPILAFGAYVGCPDAENSLFYERMLIRPWLRDPETGSP